MTKRNMKIEINESQPLDDVVRELERLGCELESHRSDARFVYVHSDGSFDCFFGDHDQDWFSLTTLAELKENK